MTDLQSDPRAKHIIAVPWIENTSCFYFTGHLRCRRNHQGGYKIESGTFKSYKPQIQWRGSDFYGVLEDEFYLFHNILKL